MFIRFIKNIYIKIIIVFLSAIVPTFNIFLYAQINNFSVTNDLPAPGKLLSVSQNYSFPTLKGIKVNPQNPLDLEFIVDTKNQKNIDEKEARRLVAYFMAALTTPDKDIWVNLSPYESGRIIPDELSITDLGKDLLGQDYILKQLTSSLTYPENEKGKKYWDQISRSAATLTQSSFAKVWIVPENVEVYENANIAMITIARLKVMSERDFIALDKNKVQNANTNEKALKDLILPTIEKEVNFGQNFATLRQIHSAFILAAWFKKRLRESIFKSYIDQKKVLGIDLDDKTAREKIYNLYVEAFKKGAYNYTKKEYSAIRHTLTKRQYFSGGILLSGKINFHPLDSSSPIAADPNDRLIKVGLGSISESESNVTGDSSQSQTFTPGSREYQETAEALETLMTDIGFQWSKLSTEDAAKLLDQAEGLLVQLGNPDYVDFRGEYGGNIRRSYKKELLQRQASIVKEIKLEQIAAAQNMAFIHNDGSWMAPNLEDIAEQPTLDGHVTTFDALYDIIFTSEGILKRSGADPIFVNSGGEGQAARVRLAMKSGIVPIVLDARKLEAAGIICSKNHGEKTYEVDIPLRFATVNSRAFMWQSILIELAYRKETLTEDKKMSIAKALGYENYAKLEQALSSPAQKLAKKFHASDLGGIGFDRSDMKIKTGQKTTFNISTSDINKFTIGKGLKINKITIEDKVDINKFFTIQSHNQ
jgi:hypothetical protein